MLTMFRRSATRAAAVSLFTLGLVVACGSDESLPGAPPDIFPDTGPVVPPPDASYVAPVGKPCVEGTMPACKVLLPAHGSIHPCFVGVQICTHGKLGPCVEKPEAGTVIGSDGSVVH
jgi:hypothetical protein